MNFSLLMSVVDPILNPTVWIGDFEFREPVTSLTDFGTATVCIVSFVLLMRIRSKNFDFRIMRLYFISMGIAMLIACSLGHALQAYVSPDWKALGWSFGALAVGLLEFASVRMNRVYLTGTQSMLLKAFVILRVSTLYILLLNPATRNFDWVKMNSTIGLLFVVLTMQLLQYIKTKNTGSKYIIGAVLWGIFPAIVYNLQLSADKWFNYHDISHIMMSIYCLILFFGVRAYGRASKPESILTN